MTSESKDGMATLHSAELAAMLLESNGRRDICLRNPRQRWEASEDDRREAWVWQQAMVMTGRMRCRLMLLPMRMAT